jgi:putative hemolysin
VDVPLGVGLLGLVCLLALQALFSASEIGFLAISPARARNMRDAGSRTAGLILFLKRYRSLSLAALLLGITGTVYTAERLAADVSIGLLGAQIGPWVSIVVLSLLVLVFAEVTPISWAARNPVAAARVGAFPMAVVAILALPATLVMAAFALVVEWLLRNVAGAPPAYTEDELKTMIDEITDRGEYAPTEQRMLKGVLDFGDQTAAQVMVPRTDMACVEADEMLGAALDLMLSVRHSRLPVYADDRDNILGVLYAKDVLPYMRRGETDKPCRLVARPALVVPESIPADELLRQLQAGRRLLAIVQDEFGGTAGLVTVEDLLEEIVGPIQDEYDEEEPEVRVVGKREWNFAGTVNLHEVANYVVTELPEDEFDSLAGLILAETGHIPEEGEKVAFGRLELVVERMVAQRIERVRVIERPPGDFGSGGEGSEE